MSCRLFLQRSAEPGAADAALAGDTHLRDAASAQPDIAHVRGRFIAARSGDGRDDALRGVVLDMLEVWQLPLLHAHAQMTCK